MWGDTVKKLFISQPMRGREYDAIMAERKALIADAAVALRTDDVEVRSEEHTSELQSLV